MRLVALDIETTGLDPKTDRIHGVGLVSERGSHYMDIRHEDAYDRVEALLTTPDVILVGHNLRFDLKFLQEAGMRIPQTWYDTKILAQLINENRPLGLKDLSQELLGHDSLEEKREIDRAVSGINGKSIADLCRADLDDPAGPFRELIGRYCLEDCQNTLALWKQLVPKLRRLEAQCTKAGLKKTTADYFRDEAMALEPVLTQVELFGVAIDAEQLRAFNKEQQAKEIAYRNQLTELCLPHLQRIEERLYEKVKATKKSEKGKENVRRSDVKQGTKFLWTSTSHLTQLLFNELGFDPRSADKTPSGSPSTGETSLIALSKNLQANSPNANILRRLVDLRGVQKLLSTYTGEDTGLGSHIRDGRIYAEYLQAGRGREGSNGGTVTGRLSSRNPNLQNLPRGSEIKRFFKPDPGHLFVYFDYSQLELRIAAHLSQDPLMLRNYQEGSDLHQITGDNIGVDRQMGKTINFAMIYDASSYRLASILNRDPQSCQQIINDFYDLYHVYKRYLTEQRKLMEATGVVWSPLGRIRRLPALLNPDTPRKEFMHAIKQGYNFPIQSLGASITKRAMIALHKQGYRIVTQVHDSVICQLREDVVFEKAKDIQAIAENVVRLRVPLKADVKILTSFHEEDTVKLT